MPWTTAMLLSYKNNEEDSVQTCVKCQRDTVKRSSMHFIPYNTQIHNMSPQVDDKQHV